MAKGWATMPSDDAPFERRVIDAYKQVDPELKALCDGLGGHPLATQWRAKLAAGRGQVQSAADVLGERVAVLADWPLIQVMAGAWDTEFATKFIGVAYKAAPYLWMTSVLQEAQALDLPRHRVSKAILPAPVMWWTYEDSAKPSLTVDGRTVQMDWTLLFDSSDYVTLLAGGMVGNESPVDIEFSIAHGTTYPDDLDGDPRASAKQWILALLAFLNSPYIPKRQAGLPRAERRRLGRAGLSADEVTFVDLRTPLQVSTGDSQNEATSQYHHRWIVRGHYRAQWYPSESAHHVIYIAPYVKGPEDKPLLEHAYRVRR